MSVLVCGSRDWTNETAIFDVIGDLKRQEGGHFILIHGGAKGADAIASKAARHYALTEMVVHPDWDKHGRRAGLLRNLAMLDLEPSLVVAFSNGSTGTQHTIDAARKRGIPVRVYGHERADFVTPQITLPTGSDETPASDANTGGHVTQRTFGGDPHHAANSTEGADDFVTREEGS